MMQQFLRWEAAGGILLLLAMTLALIIANTPLSIFYNDFIDLIVQVRVGELNIEKPLLLWINDGLMAVFFLMVGLEVKREILEGELSRPAQVVLPLFAAVGGMVVPALVYSYFNYGDPMAMRGWAVPTATDIAFALGLLSLLGNRVPPGLKIFLLAIAIMDDLGAIMVIALFYTEDLSITSIIVSALALCALIVLNRLSYRHIGAYILIGIVMWVSVLKSGVHATLAGVLLAFTIPLKFKDGSEGLLLQAEHKIHPYVAFFILPLFAFVNTGIDFSGMTLSDMTSAIPMGIAAGLIIGKPLGVFLFSAVPIILGWAKLPKDVGWAALFGVGALCGVGLTMSLFIGTLAFGGDGREAIIVDRLGVLMGSWGSAIIGLGILWLVLPKRNAAKIRESEA